MDSGPPKLMDFRPNSGNKRITAKSANLFGKLRRRVTWKPCCVTPIGGLSSEALTFNQPLRNSGGSTGPSKALSDLWGTIPRAAPCWPK